MTTILIPFGLGITATIIYKQLKQYFIRIKKQDNDSITSSLTKFNIKNFQQGDNVFIIGKRGSGKSTFISKILQNHEDKEIGMIVSPTENLERFYHSKYQLSKVKLYTKYTTDIIGKYIQKQIDEINNHIIDDEVKLIVLDNCLLELKHNDNTNYYLTYLLINGFFYKSINIVASSFPLEFWKYYKSNIDYICIFNDKNMIYREEIYNNYFYNIVDYKTFVYLIESFTQNYQCLIIDYKNDGKIYYY